MFDTTQCNPRHTTTAFFYRILSDRIITRGQLETESILFQLCIFGFVQDFSDIFIFFHDRKHFGFTENIIRFTEISLNSGVSRPVQQTTLIIRYSISNSICSRTI